MSRFEVIESRVWLHAESGRKVSIYGAVPYRTSATDEGWAVVPQGFTIRDNHFGTVGCGRPPFATREKAQALADKFNAR